MLETPADPPVQTTTSEGPSAQTPTSSAQPTNSPTESPAADDESDGGKGGSWWDSLWDKVDDIKDWAGGVADAIKGNHPHSDK